MIFKLPQLHWGVVPFQQDWSRGKRWGIQHNTVIIEPAKFVQENTLALLFGVYFCVFMCLWLYVYNSVPIPCLLVVTNEKWLTTNYQLIRKIQSSTRIERRDSLTIPSGKLRERLKIAMYSWFTHENCWLSIVVCRFTAKYLGIPMCFFSTEIKAPLADHHIHLLRELQVFGPNVMHLSSPTNVSGPGKRPMNWGYRVLISDIK